MNKKGFTLIELLAVIVILAIIALIATPAVLNIIEDSKKAAATASARNIASTAKTYYMAQTMQGSTPSTIDLSGTTLLYDGDQATKGYIMFTDGKPSGKMYISGYCVEINIDGTVASEKVNSNECDVTVPIVYTKYNDGDALLYDPVNNVKCSDAQVEVNVNAYKNTHNDEYGNPTITGLNSGCMKWYAFLDSEESSTVNLILDHNTTGSVTWNENTGTTPDTVNAKLQADITNWNAAVKSTARLISAAEVNQIAPVAEYSTPYYLHNGNQAQYKGEAGSNTYAWLFDNTYNCTTYGCNTADSGTYGYWTSSLANTDGYAWFVGHTGNLGFGGFTIGLNGVRPVITVDKSIFE